MDSFFKAAVCDLDKVLDDFELSAEVDCTSVFRKPSPYDLSAPAPSEASGAPPDLPRNPPDPSSLRYGAASGGVADQDGELKVQPLTGVDLLSSVDHGAAQSSAPPCLDRALKPVCDLVNDTGSAVPIRADGRDAFGDPDAAGKQSEEEEKKDEDELLVDFGDLVLDEGGATSQNCHRQLVGASLSLLDVILPAVPVEDAREESDAKDEGYEEELQDEDEDECSGPGEQDEPQPPHQTAQEECPQESDDELPEAEEQQQQQRQQVEDSEAESLSGSDTCPEEPLESQSPQRCSLVPPAEPPHPDPTEASPAEPPEFGFEYLPESDRAELLVTDEELDAFLRAHAEAERTGGFSCSGGSAEVLRAGDSVPLNGDLERAFADEELRSCREDLERLASPESDRSVRATRLARESPSGEDSCRGSRSSTCNSLQSEQQISYGGARPKQLPCAAARSPASAEGDDELPACSSDLDAGRGFLAHSVGSPAVYAPQDPPEYSAAYDELSEPPPYPGEPPARKRDGAEEEPGVRQPAWVPDSEAPVCMNCSQRFTFTKRRHHCRACGKVYCAGCCNRKCKLKYLDKEARVCVICFDTLHRAQALERMMSPTGPSPNPNVPSEYCSTIPPLQQARAAGTLNSPPPTVMVPVSALKQSGNDGCPREHKRVWFADGILPNGEVADTAKLSVSGRGNSQDFAGAPEETTDQPPPAGSEGESCGRSSPETAEVVPPPPCGPWDYALLAGLGSAVRKSPSLLPDCEDQLPPLLITTGEDSAGDASVEESPAPCQIRHLLEEGGPRPLTFVLNANLLVNVKMVTYSGRQCWCFGSSGLQALGQRELVFLLECVPEERTLPRDLFTLCLSIQQDAQRGKFVEDLDNVTFTGSFLGSKEHAGMLFFSPTCQPLGGLSLPSQPFLFGLLVLKLEVPWAKVFPLRLLLRLGAEYSVYPTTPVSVRFRESVYRETGHTIMNLLADLRNYQYSLSSVGGLRIHMEVGRSYIDVPKSSFGEMQRVVNGANEHVISIGANFSSEADSHLVCFQNEDGTYQTQAGSVPGKTRTVTGASFVVFNGALKASSGFVAKSSIVEDGLMVQMPPETMEALRTALREQKDFEIACGKTDETEVRETVAVRWVDWASPVNAGVTSGVDGCSLEGVRSVRMRQDARFECDGRVIGCSEVFYRPTSPDGGPPAVPPACAVFQKEIAVAACGALTPHLAVLGAAAINSLSLRVSTHGDVVEYQAGSGGRLLPQRYMNELDGALIPVIHGGGAVVPPAAADTELLFFITHAI
ncbi:zinc finger FYVE domain-containing protein 16 isoform X2 [Syngnathoides biaculeatus]|uniref:zinc finger FYVE domain-containing protein 16 isoform X2 n=1 Tax=Syngnathoides biaculeatus TaxID=300417 RepID=UPI002ADDB188|nr:zinc finger FYVE domain-containing protein 16 isoform X2 [Syngnathoides biaculeatus]